MKNNILVLLIIVALIVGGLLYYDRVKFSKLADAMESKIDLILEQNQNTLNGALDSYNFALAQKEEVIQTLVTENQRLVKEKTHLLKLATEQELQAQPVLEQFPEVKALVETQKQVIATQEQEIANLKEQLTVTQEQLAVAKQTVQTLVKQNQTLVDAIQDLRKDLSVLAGKKPTKLEQAVTWGFRGLVVYSLVRRH